MDVATISLGALLITIILSCTSRIHVGFLAISLAWVVGVYIAGLSPNEVMSRFPTRLFLTLAGVTQWDVRSNRTPCGSVLSRQCWHYPDYVLWSGLRTRVDWAWKHRSNSLGCANGNGGGRPGGYSRFLGRHHGWQRCKCWFVIADCTNRNHR